MAEDAPEAAWATGGGNEMKTKDIPVAVGEVYLSPRLKMDAVVTRLNPSRTQVAFKFDDCECVLPKSEFLRQFKLKEA